MKTTILAIESSCDDTAAAILQDGILLSNCVATQESHRLYGGVVPELASREHLKSIVPVVFQAMSIANIKKDDLSAIAFTRGPGLIGSLLVGGCFAKSLALCLDLPLIEVHHMQAHVLAHFIEDPKPIFPFICLTISGGHTQFVLVKSPLEMEVVGRTLDDAAGEAFDKSGKILGLDYPAGPVIDRLAKEGNPVFEFPEPKIPGFDFSFSGLKTAISYFIRDRVKEDSNFIANNLNDICRSIQDRIISILLNKLELVSHHYAIKEIAIAGGVAANSGLRTALDQMGKRNDWNTYIPKLEFCTDNAAMIAMTGYFKYLEKDFTSQAVIPKARMVF